VTATGRDLSDVDHAVPLHQGMFGAVLIDLDGVLIDSRQDVLDLWRTIATEHRVELPAGSGTRDILGCVPEHTVQALFGHLDAASRDRILDRVRAAEPGLGFTEMPGARLLVRDLHLAGVPLALVTGASRQRARRVLDRLGLTSQFATIVAWGDVPSGKPAPDCYLLAASRLGMAPQRCLVLEDAPAGVTAAITAGTSCVGVCDQGAAELADRGARPVVASVADLDCVRSGQVALVAAGRPVAYLES
jgi:sugar-phosphatase